MERITTLLDKIRELNKSNISTIDIDLMIDYTKVIYADLLEYRNKTLFNENAKIKEPEKPTGSQTVNFNLDNFQFPKFAPTKAPEELNPKQTVFSNTPPSPPSPLPHFRNFDIRQHIGINDKYLFISELFNNDREAFDEVISEINTFDSEEEAVKWLNENVYQQYQWKEDTDVLQAFYRSINDFFNLR